MKIVINIGCKINNWIVNGIIYKICKNLKREKKIGIRFIYNYRIICVFIIKFF